MPIQAVGHHQGDGGCGPGKYEPGHDPSLSYGRGLPAELATAKCWPAVPGCCFAPSGLRGPRHELANAFSICGLTTCSMLSGVTGPTSL
jgi:hypothetical protein